MHGAYIRGDAGDFSPASSCWSKRLAIFKINSCKGDGRMYNWYQLKFWERSDDCDGAGVIIEGHSSTDDTSQPRKVRTDRFSMLHR